MDRAAAVKWGKIIAIAALFAPSVALILMRQFPDALDPLWMWPNFHFWSSGVTALAGAVACVVVIAAARTLRQTRLLFLTLAFVCIGGIFSVHGLLTPGVIKHDFHAALAVSAWVSVFAGATFAALSGVRFPAAGERFIERAGIVIFAWTVVAVGTYITLSWVVEDWLASVPTDNRQVQYLMAIAATALFAFAAYRYAQAWFFARLPAQAALAMALILLMQIPPILLLGQLWQASWWLYHFSYGAAFIVLFAGWALEYRRAGSLSAIADALAMRDAMAQLNRGRASEVLHLVEEIEAKDHYTVGHVHRVGEIALAIGQQLGLSQGQLHDVVLASQMHDVGKIATPDMILQKAGKLTDAETAEMRRHASIGGDIAARVGALRGIAPAVRAHHERFDGAGYPDGLAGEEIPLAARICSVADTYDAMTSTRSYRKALPHETAIAEILRVRGTQLDPRCVDAFVAVFGDRAAAA